MDHYFDIRVRPDPEFPAGQLINALFAKLHRALVQIGSDAIWVSFPEACMGLGLGPLLRLRGFSAALSDLQGQAWLIGMCDHVQLSEVTQAPTNAQHCRIRRVQSDSNPERLRRKAIKRHGLS